MYDNVVTRLVLPTQSQIASEGGISVQAPWSRLVARFLAHGSKFGSEYETSMVHFLDDSKDSDPRDPNAFACMLHYYLGMARSLENNNELATAEFQKVIDTHRVDLLEYWASQARVVK